MEFYFAYAGSVVHITGEDPEFCQDAGKYSEYLVPPQNADRRMICRMVDKLSLPSGKLVFREPARNIYSDGETVITYLGSLNGELDRAYTRISRRGSLVEAEFLRSAAPNGIYAKGLLQALEVEHVAIENQGFVLHAACIEHEGAAIVFTAPSGTGKSTQADLWKAHRGAEVINGDRIMIQSADEGFRIVGIPYCGSSRINKNRTLPLKAIVYLQQAPGNRATVLRGMEAFKRVWEGCSIHVWNRKDMEQCMATVTRMLGQVPVIRLECTPDLGAVEALEAIV